MPITHTKVNAKTDWTQAQLNTEIAAGNFPAGTLLADITLPSDWNAAHTIDTITATGGTVVVSTPVFSGTQTWNDAAVTFTGFKLNITSTASAAASLLMDLQLATVSQFSIDKSGNVTTGGGVAQNGNITVPRASYLKFASSALILSDINTSSGAVQFQNAAGNTIWAIAGSIGLQVASTGLFSFTSTSNATGSPDTGIARKAAKITEFNTGTAATYAGTAFGNGTQTVAQLPTASTCTGFRAMVSDALTPTFGATVASGGAVVTPVYSDGTNWKVG